MAAVTVHDVEYIRFAGTHVAGRGDNAPVTFKYCIQWRGVEQDDQEYLAEGFEDEEVLRQFWQHLDERTIPPDGLYPHDAKVLEDIDRQHLELVHVAGQQGGIPQQRADELRPRLEALDPDILTAALARRRDFGLTGECDDEAGVWEFVPMRGKSARAVAPYSVASRRPSAEALEYDFRTIVLQQDAPMSDTLHSSVDDDARVLFAEDGWPARLKRLSFDGHATMQRVLLSSLGKDFTRKLTRWWRRTENHDVCMICYQDVYYVWEDLVCTDCMHIYCKACIVSYWQSLKALNVICPACRQEPQWCPFPATALVDPWRAKNWPPALPLDAGAEDLEDGEIKEAGKQKKRQRRGGAKARADRKRKLH